MLPLLLFCSMGKHFIGAPTSPRGEESRLFCSLSAVVSQIWNFCPGYMCVYSRLYTTHTHWKTGNQNLSDVFPPLTETLGDTPPPTSSHYGLLSRLLGSTGSTARHLGSEVHHLGSTAYQSSSTAHHLGSTAYQSSSTAHQSGRCSKPLRHYRTPLGQYSTLRQVQHTT